MFVSINLKIYKKCFEFHFNWNYVHVDEIYLIDFTRRNGTHAQVSLDALLATDSKRLMKNKIIFYGTKFKNKEKHRGIKHL